MSWRRTIFPLFVALPLAACSTMAPQRGARGEVAEMKARILDLQRRAAMTEVELAELRRKVAELESGENGTTAPSKAVGMGSARGEAVQGTPSAGPAEGEERSARIEVEDLTAAPPPQQRAPAVAPPVAPPPAAPLPPAGSSSAPVTPAAQALYDRGYTLYHQGRYLDAEASFQKFLEAYDHSDLADNAAYWIGESRLARGDARGALAAFRRTVEQYPDGNKVPDALLQAGRSLTQLGDAAGARASYQEVIDRFPGSAAASVARDRLAELAGQ